MGAPDTLDLDVYDIVVLDRHRAVREEAVVGLVESIRRLGLLNPIAVSYHAEYDGDGAPIADEYRLVAGRHRLVAFQRLGLATIPAIVIATTDDKDNRLWEIAENLHRAELTVLERAEHIAEWIRLTEEKLPQLGEVSGGRGNRGGVSEAARILPVAGSTEKARQHSIERAVKIAERTTADAKDAAREAGLDKNQSALLAVASVPPEQQVAKVRELAKPKETDPNAAIERARKALYALSENQLIAVIADVTGLLIEDVAAMFRRGAP